MKWIIIILASISFMALSDFYTNDFYTGKPNQNDVMVIVNDLKQQVSSLKQQVNTLSSNQDKINPDNLLNNNLDVNSKKIIEDVTREGFFNIFWNDYYYYSSAFEGVDRILTGGTGTATVNDNGLVIATNAAIGGQGTASLGVATNSGLMKFNKDTRFRFFATIDTVADTILTVNTLAADTTHYIGFEINDGTVYGKSKDGSTEASVTLGTVSDDEKNEYEFTYYQNTRIEFSINGEYKGTITSNFPSGISADQFLFDAIIETANAAEKTAFIYFWEFLQKK